MIIHELCRHHATSHIEYEFVFDCYSAYVFMWMWSTLLTDVGLRADVQMLRSGLLCKLCFDSTTRATTSIRMMTSRTPNDMHNYDDRCSSVKLLDRHIRFFCKSK